MVVLLPRVFCPRSSCVVLTMRFSNRGLRPLSSDPKPWRKMDLAWVLARHGLRHKSCATRDAILSPLQSASLGCTSLLCSKCERLGSRCSLACCGCHPVLSSHSFFGRSVDRSLALSILPAFFPTRDRAGVSSAQPVCKDRETGRHVLSVKHPCHYRRRGSVVEALVPTRAHSHTSYPCVLTHRMRACIHAHTRVYPHSHADVSGTDSGRACQLPLLPHPRFTLLMSPACNIGRIATYGLASRALQHTYTCTRRYIRTRTRTRSAELLHPLPVCPARARQAHTHRTDADKARLIHATKPWRSRQTFPHTHILTHSKHTH